MVFEMYTGGNTRQQTNQLNKKEKKKIPSQFTEKPFQF